MEIDEWTANTFNFVNSRSIGHFKIDEIRAFLYCLDRPHSNLQQFSVWIKLFFSFQIEEI